MSTTIREFDIGGRELISNKWMARAFGISLAFLGWIVLASIFPRRLLPYPHQAAIEMYLLFESGVAIPNLLATIQRMIWGFIGSFLVGGALGVIMGINSFGRKFVIPYVIVGISIPAVAYAAITTLIFGYNIVSPVTAVILTTFPYVAINIWKGVENIDQDLITMSDSFEVPFHRVLIRTIIPNAAGPLFAAFRFGLAISWRVTTVAELFSAGNGIGIKLIQAYQYFNYAEAWGWALIFMIMILVIEYGILKPIERRVFEYRPDADISLV